MTDLAAQDLKPFRKDDQPLTREEAEAALPQLPEWNLQTRGEALRLEKTYPFKDFQTALEFTNQVGAMAEEVNHHPDILVGWGRAAVSWHTHSLLGLHENDLIMAARTDRLYEESQS